MTFFASYTSTNRTRYSSSFFQQHSPVNYHVIVSVGGIRQTLEPNLLVA